MVSGVCRGIVPHPISLGIQAMSEIKIDRIDIESGWCVFRANDEAPPPPENLPYYLHDNMQKWLVRNKELNVRTTLPIVAGGNTVAIHVWFD
jgi:hypothetical protein